MQFWANSEKCKCFWLCLNFYMQTISTWKHSCDCKIKILLKCTCNEEFFTFSVQVALHIFYFDLFLIENNSSPWDSTKNIKLHFLKTWIQFKSKSSKKLWAFEFPFSEKKIATLRKSNRILIIFFQNQINATKAL